MSGNRFYIEEVFRVFYLFEEPRIKIKNVPLAASLKAPFYVVCVVFLPFCKFMTALSRILGG